MALDRLIVQTGTGPAVSSSIQEEVTELWNRSICTLTDIGGTGDAITADLEPALTSGLVDGMAFWLTPTANNTGAATIAINGASAIDIVDVDGNPLISGGLVSGRRYLLAADGSDLRVISGGGSSGSSLRTIYTANDTWIKPDGLVRVTVTVVAGGGAGGGVTGATTYGGGGGGGGAAETSVAAGDLASSVAITVGTGGAGSANANGGNGGSSSFGTHCVASGGTGGLSAANGGTGGAAGVGTAGDILKRGGPGASGNGTNLGGQSANGSFGALAVANNTTSAGNAALQRSGGGGSGASRFAGSGNLAGGNGANGYVIVEEFY